jgi:hypothetical protein
MPVTTRAALRRATQAQTQQPSGPRNERQRVRRRPQGARCSPLPRTPLRKVLNALPCTPQQQSPASTPSTVGVLDTDPDTPFSLGTPRDASSPQLGSLPYSVMSPPILTSTEYGRLQYCTCPPKPPLLTEHDIIMYSSCGLGLTSPLRPTLGPYELPPGEAELAKVQVPSPCREYTTKQLLSQLHAAAQQDTPHTTLPEEPPSSACRPSPQHCTHSPRPRLYTQDDYRFYASCGLGRTSPLPREAGPFARPAVPSKEAWAAAELEKWIQQALPSKRLV